jgi:DNA repair REX1-B
VSETLITIQNILQDVGHSRPDLSDWIGKLQIREKEKLQMTAALHLEKIRLYQLQQQRSKLMCSDSNDAVQDDDVDSENKEDKIFQLLQDEILSLRSRIDVCVRDINEILDEIRYAIVE